MDQHIDHQELLDIATRVGVSLLQNGAEIYRVEDSIRRIVAAYGVKEVDVFAVPTTIIVTINPVSYTHLHHGLRPDPSGPGQGL